MYPYEGRPMTVKLQEKKPTDEVLDEEVDEDFVNLRVYVFKKLLTHRFVNLL